MKWFKMLRNVLPGMADKQIALDTARKAKKPDDYGIPAADRQHLKAVLQNTSGKFVAMWQRSTGRPWNRVIDPEGLTGAARFDTQGEALKAAHAARLSKREDQE